MKTVSYNVETIKTDDSIAQQDLSHLQGNLSYNIFVNNVPLFNSLEGNLMSGREKKVSEKVNLTYGKNKIEKSD